MRLEICDLFVLVEIVCPGFVFVDFCVLCMFLLFFWLFDPFWDVFFYLFGVRVMENIEVGYGAFTVRITGGQSVKI